MYLKFYIIILVSILFTCTSQKQDEILARIKDLEYSRSTTPGVFDQYFENGSMAVKTAAIDAIAKIQDPVHLTSLRKLLVRPDPRYIEKVIFALGQIHTIGSVEILENLYIQDSYSLYRHQIIKALGKSETSLAREFLLAYLNTFPDSLLDGVITGLALLSPRDSIQAGIDRQLNGFLAHPAEGVSSAAAYFFSRHPDSLATSALIRCRLPLNTPGYKYRLRALDRILSRYGTSGIDTLLIDSLRVELTDQPEMPDLHWTGNIYRIALLANFPDSLGAKILAGFLQADIPHLRMAAIHALGKMKTQQAQDLLLADFNQASWRDKGEIIWSLADTQTPALNFLIQDNLDKGPVCFKQLLLAALARKGDLAAWQQLRQFLQVPDKRLVYTAYTGLTQGNQLKPADIRAALFSGDLALVVTAAEWITAHPPPPPPEVCTLQDLQEAYSKLAEPEDVEAMMALLKAVVAVDSVQARQFLWRVAEKAADPALANQAVELLKSTGGKYPAERAAAGLFIAKMDEATARSAQIVIRTEKGDIEVELWPGRAPATVANFISLIRKNFYNNLTFHRVVSDFVIQGGDPRGDGWGGPPYHIPCEYNEADFTRGTVGMATAGKDTGGSQFFICHSEQPHLNGRYTAFGRVLQGMEIVDKIEIDDKILEITIKTRGAL
jgi:cyclophilin family peptidyl-prolyl cis-trans isomerase/HEAT repeat protein